MTYNNGLCWTIGIGTNDSEDSVQHTSAFILVSK